MIFILQDLALASYSSAVSVVRKVPLHKFLEPGLQICGRLVAELGARQADVGVREGHIPVARHLRHVLLRLHLEVPLEDPHQRRHRHRRCVPQVIDPVLRRTPLPAAAACARLRRVQRRYAPLDDVVDVGEIAGEIGAVTATEDCDGLPLEDIASEGEVGHVRAAPGPVDGEEAKPSDGEAVNVVITMGDLLTGLLGGGV
ncbi:unnamed protein product [Musa hybrid cultivar]